MEIRIFSPVIATYILGETLTSFKHELREEHGLTYGASTVIAGKYVSN
jgi:hypothetical protein